MKKTPVALVLLAFVLSAGAEPLSKMMPIWLIPYPGAKADQASATVAAYTVAAKPEEVVAHYKKVITGASLPFLPNFDGIGISIRAAAAECDLLIKIRESYPGTATTVNCTPRTAGSVSTLYGTEVGIANPAPPPLPDPETPASASTEEPKTQGASEPKKRDDPRRRADLIL